MVSGGARARYLGGAGRTALVRCPCSRRNYFDRRRWEWFGVAVCSGCWKGILFRDLSLVGYREAEELAKESTVYAGELKALRGVEGVMRRFLVRYDEQPYWLWAPQTRRMVAELRRALRPVEAARSRRAAGDDDVRELSHEEALALDYFAAATHDRRRVVLAMLEDMSRWDRDDDDAGASRPEDAEMRVALERLEAEGGAQTPPPRPDPSLPQSGPSPEF
ncbi:MAG TPA: hypothetical protein VM864_14055 [Pyrinomonadaceae bacterium]|nr:hypothetical protein [Pyrinomonadaceae bacterium]